MFFKWLKLRGAFFSRNTDSEFKMLNKLASDLGGVKNTVYKDVIGEFREVYRSTDYLLGSGCLGRLSY